MKNKSSDREKMLRFIFEEVAEARNVALGTNPPQDREAIMAMYEPIRAFLREEIRRDSGTTPRLKW